TTVASRGQARAAEDPEEIRFADVEPLPLERGTDVSQGGPLAAEFAGPLVNGITFRGCLATGLGGGEKRVDVGVASEVADDHSNGTDMKMKTAGRFRRRVSHRGSKHGRSRSDVGLGDQVAGTGERVLGREASLLSPQSTRSQPPRDVLGAVWSQGRGSLSCGKRPKMRGFGESDVRRNTEETRHGAGRKCGELADWDSRHRRRRR